jgi:hypothetical protein
LAFLLDMQQWTRQMKCIVVYSDGHKQEHDSIQQAVMSLLIQYPSAVILDAGGYDHRETDPDRTYEVHSGRAARMWETREGFLAGGPMAEVIVQE